MKSPLFIKKLIPEAMLPTKGSALAAGYDLYSVSDLTIPAHGKSIVKTGLVTNFKKAIKVPTGNYGRIAPRSGLAVKNFIDVGAGVIDEDYRGEVGVVLFNFSDIPFQVKFKILIKF